MQAKRVSLTSVTWCLLLGALVLLAGSSPLLAASGGSQATLETPQMLQGTSQIAGTTTGAEPTLATPAADASVPVISQGALLTSSIVYNPCYTFDNPSTGCYYTWSPQTYCCIGNSRCPDICW